MRRAAIALLLLASAALLAADLMGMLGWACHAAAACGMAAGVLGWPRAPRATPASAAKPSAMAEIAPVLRELAEEMARLKRDSAETSRGMAEARAGAGRMAQAAATAIARLDESAETSAIAARALALLPGIADSHAQRIELMAARAEQALAMVPESLAVPPPFAAALERLEGIALPDTAALREAVARLDNLPGEIGQALHGSLAEAHDANAALLDQAAARIEAARPDPLLSVALMEATERLDALAGPMDRARAGADAAAEHLQAALGDAAGRLDRAHDGTTAVAERLHGALEAQQAALDAASAQLATLTGRIEDAHPQHRLIALDEALAVLPAMAESAQRATDALLRAAQANIALAARPREAAPETEVGSPRQPRLLTSLEDTIRGLQSLSSVIAAAAERRLENAD